MKRFTRRDFAKTLGSAALAVPASSAVAAGWSLLPPARRGSCVQAPPKSPPSPSQQPAPQETPPPGANLPLTPEQQQRVKQFLERDASRRALMRPAPLPYDLEPAFIFTVRRRPHGPR